MLKLAGCLLIVGATTMLGIGKAKEVQEEYRQMQYLEQLIYRLLSEISYQRSYLGEIFASLGRQVQKPYKEWLLNLSRDLGERDRGTFEDIWKENIQKYLKDAKLPPKELLRLSALGSQLGLADLEYQKKTLELYIHQLTETMEEVREGMRMKVRLCHCLGVMSGMLIAVLLL